eukprot:TRINITY_DN726_c0_g1_i1.p1 TRINITY_DN726_c0_g1~~TRINITY_DN726_c0_g1_i1.p1  ORF type:complete len:218 (-),score=42.22 TRINITY_DN726_c0_g1_i1:723-1376(-)
MADTEDLMSCGVSDRGLDVIGRYYTKHYAIDFNGAGNDQYVFQHTNYLCVIGLAPTHPIVKERKKVVSINWAPGRGKDHSQIKLHGKRKRGAVRLDPNSKLCEVTCEDSTKYMIYSTVRGALVEVNTKLVCNNNNNEKQETEGENQKQETEGGNQKQEKEEEVKVEANYKVLDPYLLCDKPSGEGYIAIIKPDYQDQKKVGNKYISHEQYVAKMSSA